MDVRVTKSLDSGYDVDVWVNCWNLVSHHLHKADADKIATAIKHGANSRDICEKVRQQDREHNTLCLSYFVNWY